MQQSLLVVLLLGLSTSIYALDLSHAAQPAAVEVDPRIFNFLNDFYAQVVYPPLNHIVTNVALLSAQVLAGIGVNGLPAPGGRMVKLSDDELRGFWSGLWNDALRPPIENALSGLSLMAAQVLAGIGINGVDLTIGKRELDAEQARIFDVLLSIIKDPVENAISTLALMAAQVLAGVGTNGVDLSNLGGLFGKRELNAEEARIFDVLLSIIKDPVENAISTLALMAAQVLAGVGTNGVDLSNLGGLFGKRELNAEEARIFDVLLSIIKDPVENAISTLALMAAQVLAGVGTNGVDLSNLGGLFGKRELNAEEARIFDVLLSIIKDPVENAISTLALMAAQVLAGVGTNGVDLSNLGGLFGKRELNAEEARIFDVLLSIIKDPVENAISTLALMAAQVLAGVGTNGVDLSNLGGLFGKRELNAEEARIFDVLLSIIKDPVENAISTLALMAAQVLAGVGTNGVDLSNLGGLFGKRELNAEEARIFDVLLSIIKDPVENAISTLALMAAQVLAGVGTNGVDLSNLGGLFGKRELNAEEARIFDVLLSIIKDPVENAISTLALMAAQVLAGVGTNGVDLSNLGGLFGKRELNAEEARIFDVLLSIIKDPVENAISTLALMAAQVLAGVGTNGVDLSNLGGLFGKRELNAEEAAIRGVLDTLGGAVVNGLQAVWNNIFAAPLGSFIQNGALAGAQLLAGLGTNGVNLGKRSTEARGAIIDSLLEHASGLYATQVKPVIENALNNAVLQLAGVLANFSQNGFGRR